MSWKKAGQDKSKYIRFEAGKSFEGTYQGWEERENPFYDPKNPNSDPIITDYKLDIGTEERILSSTAQTLKDQLKSLIVPCAVKIECVQKGIKKWYQVWTE